MQTRKIQIGQLIREKVKERKMSIPDFANAIHSSRTNVYNILKAQTVDVEKLMLISEVLNYDFFKHYCKKTTKNEKDYDSCRTSILVAIEEDEIVIKQAE